jgi:branched-subunit amino acid aminotransferase/4-amino-4-deoxychorismate lyase
MNGEVIDATAPALPPLSAGATLGWGVFTTAGVRHGQAFLLDRHLQRLRRDAARTDIPLQYDDDTLSRAVATIFDENQISDGLLRITLLRRGDGRWNNADGSDLFITAKAAQPNHTPSTQRLRLVLSPFRVEARRALAGVKSTSCLDYQLAWQDAARKGLMKLCYATAVALCAKPRALTSSGCVMKNFSRQRLRADACPELRANWCWSGRQTKTST